MTAERDEAREYVLGMVREHDVKFIRLWFTDILGALKGFAITAQELEEALEQGVGFDGSSIEGFARIDESDMVAMPDPTTFRILPWRPRQNAVARMFCDILTPQWQPFEGDPRHVLKRTLERASSLGYTYYVGPELEYFYFRNSEGTDVLDEGGYFDQTPLDLATELRRETVLTLEEMGIAVEFSHHEAATSQHEIDLRYSDALTMADNVMTQRLVIKEVAMRNGLYATFMPKPIANVNGSGMHVHQSLFKGATNAFFDADSTSHLSPLALSFVAGLMHHAPAITAITNQWVNLLQEAHCRLRGSCVHIVGQREQVRPDPGARLQGRARRLGANRVPRAGPGLQPVSRLRGHACLRLGRSGAWPARARPRPRERIRHDERGARAQGHRDPAGEPPRGHPAH